MSTGLDRPRSATALDHLLARTYASPAFTRLRRDPRVRKLFPLGGSGLLHRLHLSVNRSRLERPVRRPSPVVVWDDSTPDELPAGVTPFLVLASGRSGTTLLVDELNRRWDDVRSLREAFSAHTRVGHSFEETLGRVYFTDSGHRFVGCKIFRGHVTDSELRRILALPGMRVVILRRTNVLRKYVSLLIAIRDDQWHASRADPIAAAGDRAVDVDLPSFLRYRAMTDQAYDRFDQAVRGLPVLRITYEDLSADLDGTLRRVGKFLGAGAPDIEPAPHLVRQNPEPLRMLIRNYDELRPDLERLGLRDAIDPDDPTTVAGVAAAPDRTGWPTPVQEVVLHAALDPPAAAAESLSTWIDSGESWCPDGGVQRLLPLLHRRTAGVDLPVPIRDALHHAHVEARRDNLVLLHALGDVLDVLAGSGFDTASDTLVLKGAALALVHYVHLGDRPMNDLDVLIRPERVATALTALRAAGWRFLVLPDDSRIDDLIDVRHSVALVRDGLELDLHWHAMVESVGGALDDELWSASVPLDVLGRPTRALAPSDQVLHAVVLGLRWNPVPTVRCVADAHVVITSTASRPGPDLDWRRLATLARTYWLAAPVGAGIAYLAAEFPGLVPDAGRCIVASVPIGARDRRIFEHGLVPHGPTGTAVSAWYRYRRRVPHRSAVGAVPGFVHDMMRQLDLDHAGQLPGRIARETRARVGRRRASA